MNGRVWVLAWGFSLLSSVVHAQTTAMRDTAAAEIVVGHAGFVDDATIHHGVLGGAIRWYVTPRVSVGPEIVYMRGPRDDRDLMLTGNVTFDFLSPVPRHRFTPFAVVGGGWFRHSDRFGPSSEGAFTAGIGLRANVSDRWYVGGDARFGWELHTRVAGVVGIRLP
jgi:hypothetical protein